jgi:hypothetical protein
LHFFATSRLCAFAAPAKRNVFEDVSGGCSGDPLALVAAEASTPAVFRYIKREAVNN